MSKGWTTVTLGDIAENVSVRVDDPSKSGLDRFVGLVHLDSGSVIVSRWDSAESVTSSMKQFQAGDVLLARRNAHLRRASAVDFGGVCSGDAYVLREKPDAIVPGLLKYILNTNRFWEYAIANADGSMSTRVKWNHLQSYKIGIPSTHEQKKSLAILESMVETEIRFHRLSSVLESVYESFREHKVFNDNNPLVMLGDLLEGITAGKSLKAVNNPPKNNEKAVLKIGSIGRRRFVPSESKILNIQSEFLPEHMVKSGFLLISRANTLELVGQVCLVESDYPNLMLSDKTLRLDLKPDLISKRVLLELLRCNSTKIYFRQNGTGTGGQMKNISQREIMNIPLKIPEKGIHVKLDSMLRRLDAIEDYSNRNQHLIEGARRATIERLIG